MEVFQQQQQLKWIAHIILKENNYVIKLLSFHTTITECYVCFILDIIRFADTAAALGFYMFLWNLDYLEEEFSPTKFG